MAKDKVYSWFGGGANYEPQTDASTNIADIIQLIPPLSLADEAGARTRFLIEAIYLKFSVQRLLATNFDALGFIVYQMAPRESDNLPTTALDALSLSSRLYARKSIMMMAPLDVPPNVFTSDLLAASPNDEIKTSAHEYQAMRKHDRANQILCLAINSDVSVVTSVFSQWRVLVSWS